LHFYQTSHNIWVSHQGGILTPGHGPLLVIFGAIVIFRNGSSNKLHGKLVPNSVHIWDPTIKSPENRGRKRNNAEEWNDILDVVKMPILFLTKLIIMEILMQKYLRIFFQLCVKIFTKNMVQ
jgi:hypothetical protein